MPFRGQSTAMAATPRLFHSRGDRSYSDLPTISTAAPAHRCGPALTSPDQRPAPIRRSIRTAPRLRLDPNPRGYYDFVRSSEADRQCWFSQRFGLRRSFRLKL